MMLKEGGTDAYRGLLIDFDYMMLIDLIESRGEGGTQSDKSTVGHRTVSI